MNDKIENKRASERFLIEPLFTESTKKYQEAIQ